MKYSAVYPGTFDPITYGHIDVLKRSAKLFNGVIMGIAEGEHKKTLFPATERLDLAQKALKGVKQVKIETFKGLAVNYVKSKNIKIVIRGLRMISDFEYEFQMALTNKHLNKTIETLFMMPKEKYAYISSSLIKEAAALGADLGQFVPKPVEAALKKKLTKNNTP